MGSVPPVTPRSRAAPRRTIAPERYRRRDAIPVDRISVPSPRTVTRGHWRCDRGGGVPLLLRSVSQRFSTCATLSGSATSGSTICAMPTPPGCSSVGCTRRSSARRWATPRSRSRRTPRATSCRACRRRPTPSMWYSASDGVNLAATERLRSRGWGVSAARLHSALVAQWREQRFPKPRAAGSIPAEGTPSTCRNGLPEWSREAVVVGRLWAGCGQAVTPGRSPPVEAS